MQSYGKAEAHTDAYSVCYRSRLSRAGDLGKRLFANETYVGYTEGSLDRGKEEFDHFANQTWAKLIEECEQDIGCSGLTLFGRLDISLVEIMPHTFQFYVNEVERSATCNLFYDNFTCEGVRLVAKFVDALPRFCRELC